VADERAELERDLARTLASIEHVAVRLEETAASLATLRAGHGGAEAETLLASLRLDVDVALAATREVGLLA
jgi:hypothetical protein